MNLNFKKFLLILVLFFFIFLVVKLNQKNNNKNKINKLNNLIEKKVIKNKSFNQNINNKIINKKIIEKIENDNKLVDNNFVQIESTLSNDSGENCLVNYKIKNKELKLNNNKYINYNKYKPFENIKKLKLNIKNKDSVCQNLDITQNKNFHFQMNDSLLLPSENNILNTYLYRVTKYYSKNNDDETNEKICFKKKSTHGYYLYNWLNNNIKLFNIDLEKYMSFNVARFIGNFSNLMRINNIPKGNLINFYKSNIKFKSIFVSDNRNSINLNKLNINTNGLDMIEIKSINLDSNDKDYFYNHIIFKNTPILFIANTKLKNVYDILEGNENTVINLYNGTEIINIDNRKFNVYNVPFDCSINLDERYNLYSDNDNKKSIIYNLGKMELYLNSKLRVINKKNFVGMNCNLDDIPY